MIVFHAPMLRSVTFIAVCALPCSGLTRQHSLYDRTIPDAAQLSASLELAGQLSTRTTPTAKELLLLYYAEKRIGRTVWGESPGYHEITYSQPPLFSHCHDSIIAAQAVAYIRANYDRFRVVYDGWKGEENFLEPTDSLLSRLKQLYLQTIEAMEMEFDLEFNTFIRRFWIDPDAQGKTCDQYCKDELEHNGELKEAYADVEIAKWPAECAKEREVFGTVQKQLLNKYRNASFTKVLSDIDVTTIVVHHSAGD